MRMYRCIPGVYLDVSCASTGHGWISGYVCAQGRFAAHVFPGETLRTEMWLQLPHTVVFQTRVAERNVLSVTNAAVVFREGGLAAAAAKL